jgi:hypothetical protein
MLQLPSRRRHPQGRPPGWQAEVDPSPLRLCKTMTIRVIGFSPTAGFVITVIATATAHAGATAWKSSGADLREYEGQETP